LFKEGGGLSESKRLDVPLLAQIPYSEELMLSIDQGEPLVFSNDKHHISEIFNKIANSLQK
jgi:ATP-binding protein involved in chromosome partitioning